MPSSILTSFPSSLSSQNFAQADSIRALPEDLQNKALWMTYYYGQEKVITEDSTWLERFDQLESDFRKSCHKTLAQQNLADEEGRLVYGR